MESSSESQGMGRKTRSKSRAKTLSTIINSLHELSTTKVPAETQSNSGSSSETENPGPLPISNGPKPELRISIKIKQEPVSDLSSDEMDRRELNSDEDAPSSRTRIVADRSNDDDADPFSADASYVARRKRGRPKKDSIVKVQPLLPGEKRKQVRYKDHPCEVCGKYFDSYYLKIHMRRHTGEKPFVCRECNKKFRKKSLLKSHFKRHHGELDDLICDVCGNVFSSKGNLKAHKLVHSNEKPHKCKVCQKTFRQAVHLAEHEKTHGNEFPYQCIPCGKQYKAKISLDKHRESFHEGIKRVFPCHLCDKSFTRKAKLNDHVNFHLGQSRHLCEYCGKPFLSRKTLRTHLLIHEDKKPFLCQVCGRAFRQSNVLKLHMSTHTGIKPFKCNACGKQFIHRVYMVRHQCPNKPKQEPESPPPNQQLQFNQIQEQGRNENMKRSPLLKA